MEPPYTPPAGGSLAFNFELPYSPPEPLDLGFNFAESGGGPVGEEQYIFPVAIDQPEVGGAVVRLAFAFAGPAGFLSQAFGGTTAFLYTRYVGLTGRGFAATRFTSPSIKNATLQAFPPGIPAPGLGKAVAYNLRQYILGKGDETTEWGAPFVLGGVKYVAPNGLQAPVFSKPTVINTTADQNARASGFNALSFGAPILDPRSLRPAGFVATAVGTANAQRPPRVAGFDALRFGVLEIRDRTSYAILSGIPASEAGFPYVRDRASKLLHVASPVSAIFGDVGIRLNRLRLEANGFEALDVSPWGSVIALNRYLRAAGFLAQQFDAANEIRNATPSFAPHGFDALLGGSAAVGYRNRALLPAGIPAPFQQIASPVLTKTPSFAPAPFDAALIPGPMVAFRVRSVGPAGFVATAFELSALALKQRRLLLEGRGPSVSAFGSAARVEHGIRLLLGLGFASDRYGSSHRASLANRLIEPAGIERPEASLHMIGGTRYIQPEGYTATRWGTRIVPEAQVLFPAGFAAPFGLAVAYNLVQHARPAGITTYPQPAQRWGLARAFNSDQYVAQHPIVGSGLEAPYWSMTWTAIANRNRAATIQGFAATRFGFSQIDNKARPIMPAGLSAPADPPFYTPGLVAYRIRSLPVEGMEAPYLSTWGRVHNKAFPVRPPGLVASLFGAADVVNTTREFSRIGNFTTDAYGVPFVADAVRTLAIEGRYSIAPPRIDMPYVGLLVRYLEVPGREPVGFGLASLSIFFRRVTPRWVHVAHFGYPAVRNLTPELGARGYNMELYGETHVRLQWRPVQPEGTSMQLFGRTHIADRRQRIEVAGRNYLTVSDKLKVVKTGAPPFSTQRIWLYIPADDSVESENDASKGTSYGIPPPGNLDYGQVPEPNLNLQFLYVEQEEESTLFGKAAVTANTIRVPLGYHNYEAVAQPRVELRRRFIQCDTTSDQDPYIGLQPIEPPKARLSPHTIYAMTEAPHQAVINHPRNGNTPLHVIDGRRVGGPDIQWGAVSVQNRNRIVRPSSIPWVHLTKDFQEPRPTAANKRAVIAPPGLSSMRTGYPILPGDIFVSFFEPFVATAYGRPTVKRIEPAEIRPAGIAALAAGAHRIELLHREIKATGALTQMMGTRRAGDQPYMWQGLRVGPLMPTIPNGFSAEIYGLPMVSLRVRQVDAASFDALTIGYDINNFGERMRVRRIEREEFETRRVITAGSDAAEFGWGEARVLRQYIRPDGNSDQFRKGAW